MLPQLAPNESFPIVRVLKDHTDTSTNYVQAVIRDATTDALVDTVNLTDKGDRRFSKVWKVPYADAYNRGRYLVITTTVYTDSGYTTKNGNYAEEAETYLVQERWNPTSFQGGGSIDENQFKKVIREVLSEQKDTAETEDAPELGAMPPEKPEVDVEALVGRIKEVVTTAVDSITIPDPDKPERVDLSSIESALNSVLLELAAMPRFKEIDMSSVSSRIDDLVSEVASMKQDIENMRHGHTQEFVKFLEEIDARMESVLNENSRLNFVDAVRSGDINISRKETPNQTRRKQYLESLNAQFK